MASNHRPDDQQLHPLQTAQDWKTMPKRKPVPSASATISPASATVAAGPVGDGHNNLNSGKKRTRPLLGFGGFSFASQRPRKVLMLGIDAAVLLIALIIGLAVGLTIGKHNHPDLPLPTSNGGPYEGDLTYYDPGLGACGYTNSGTDMVCAISHLLFDAASTGSNPNENPLCGLKLRLRRNGKSIDVRIVDRCVGCAVTDLDVTEAVFKRVAKLDQGRVFVRWSWLESPPASVHSA